jgi:hypothetical protein
MSSGDDWGAAGLGAASGAGTGALIGSAVPVIGTGIGAAAGGLIGGLTGFFGSHGAHSAAASQQVALDAAMKRLQAYSQQQSAARMADLQKTMAFYDAPDAYLHSIYAQPTAAPAPVPGAGGVPAPPLGFAGAPPGAPKIPMGGLPALPPLPPLTADPNRSGRGHF